MAQSFASPAAGVPVAGIGASAGSARALRALFGAAAPGSGLAYVIVQDAGAVGLDTDAIGRHTTLSVQRVEQDVALEQDHIYVVPPGCAAQLSADRLKVTGSAPDGVSGRAIDDFFRSLASERRDGAIGVVLSGVGTHGTAGARAIRAAGGAFLAQDPHTAEFAGMARSVIEAGCADCVLPPDELASALRRLIVPPVAAGGDPPAGSGASQVVVENETAKSRSGLQSSMDAFQASTEGLESARQEVTATNEELQSANAALQKSREVLRTANGELAADNARLQAKLLEVGHATDELKSLLASMHIAVLLLDEQLGVRRFTPAVADLLELIPGDLGRPVSHLAQKLTDERLLEDARATLESAAAREAEVLSHSGRWYMRRTFPYLTGDAHVGGVVITFIDISPRKRLEIELESANARLQEALESSEALREEAERANRSKDEFIATVSHELRTPLNTIRLWSRMLTEGKLSADDAAQGAKILERSALAQQQLIDDLLDLSRMSRGQLRLELKDIRLAEAVEAAITQTAPLAQARQIEIVADLAGGTDRVRADADRLQQVASNLLNNAVKFTPVGGRVEVRLQRSGDRMELEVRDTGIGIDAEFLPFVFDRFRQGAADTARRHSGLGLGLSIAKQLVELHGGAISAESPGIGKGATFRVRLPLGAPAGEIEDVPALRATRLPVRPDLSKIEVLLVDDEPSAREALARLLEQYGASVRAVGSCAAAREAVMLHRPDVIVADIGMPGEDGYSLLRALRREEEERHERRIPALAVTAFARPEDRQRALAASFDDHMPKPVDPDRLVAAVATLATRDLPNASN